MTNESKTYAYGRVATANQLDSELKQQIGTDKSLQSLRFIICLILLLAFKKQACILARA